MEIRVKTKHIVFIILGIILLGLNIYLLMGTRWFKPLIVISLVIAGIQFFLDFLNENKRQKEIEVKFLEFVRALVETVRSGISVPKSILQISDEDFGALNPYIRKLSNQIEWGFPLQEAFTIFAYDTNNKVIKKAISIVIEAEKSGGNLDKVLESVSNSTFLIKKMKEERRTSVYSQMVQGYIIFFVFIIIMLILQIYLMPKISSISVDVQSGFGDNPLGSGFGAGQKLAEDNMDMIFTWLMIIQGLFAGLLIGKFSEGEIKYGIKHSLILIILGYLIITTVKGI